MKKWSTIIIFFFLFFSISLYSQPTVTNNKLDTVKLGNTNETNGKENYDQIKAEIDSLYLVSEKLKKQKQDINQSKDKKIGNNNHEKISSKNRIDSIQILTQEGVKAFLGSFIGKKRNTRERGYGGGLGPVLGLYAIHANPIKNCISRDPSLHGVSSHLHGSYENILLFGGTGYGGIGTGIRIGGGSYTGAKTILDRKGDTTTSLKIDVAYGGFLFEKCYIHKLMNLTIGGMVGGGRTTLSKYIYLNDFTLKEDEDNQKGYTANFMVIEFHSGFTYTLIRWLHIGLNGVTPFFISPSGFKNKSGIGIGDGFITINPGLQFRIIFGNIG